MAYQKVELGSIPAVVHSHRFTTANYDLLFKPMPRSLEITYFEKGDVEVYCNEEWLYTIPEKHLAVSFYDREVRYVSKAPIHSHVTVGILLDYTMTEVSENEVLQYNRHALPQAAGRFTAILPYHMAIPVEKNSRIPRAFEKILQANIGGFGYRSLTVSGLVMELMAEISKRCGRQCYRNRQLSPGDMVYTERAIDYIANHLSQKIRVEEIARGVGISAGYLSGIFKAVTGKTLVEYVNLAKLQRVTELMNYQGVSASEAAEQVGITDPAYLSRLFRKYLDTGIREIRKSQDDEFI